MARLEREGDNLVLRLTTGEKVAGLHGNITVPLSRLTSVDVVHDALSAVRGLRAPGLAIPGRTKIGTWRGAGGRRFVVARRNSPAVRVQLRGAKYDELIVSTADAAAVAAMVRAAAGVNGADRA